VTSELVTRAEGPAVERQVASDIVRRALPIAPLVLIGAGLGWGVGGVLSAGYAMVLILANFLASAAILAWASRTSLSLLMGSVLFGYVLRLGVITAAVLAISGQSWFEPIPLGATIIITHLGLLIWETRYVSASLAFPGLKPPRPRAQSPRAQGQKGS
jgi:hypothetical protein